MKNKRLIIGLLTILISININAQEVKSINKLFSDFNNLQSPGAVAVVVENNKISHLKGYGNANMEYEIPITPQTIFHIGSVSKQFTAFAILLLEDKGLISLNDLITDFLKDLPGCMSSIKIKHLLHHTSGLREIEKLQQIAGITTADQIDSRSLYNLIKKQSSLNFNPGDELEYSNSNYFLLAKIVESVTGERFSDWTKKNIFIPLNMTNTQFYDDCSKIVKNRAYAYGEWDNNLYKGILSYSYVGPTSVLTNGEDMAKWLMNFSDIKVGNKKIIGEMLLADDTLNSGDPIDYGNGLGVTTYKNLKVVLHSGHDAFYRAGDLYFPEHKVGIAILSNNYAINPFKFSFEIADIILKDVIKNEKVETSSEEKEDEKLKKVEKFSIENEELLEYQGNYYCNDLDVVYRLFVKNDSLYATFWRNEKIVFNPIGHDTFEGNQYWFKNVKFSRDINKTIDGFHLSSGNVRDLKFTKIDEPHNSGPGTYIIRNNSDGPIKIPFTMHNGKPLMKLKINGQPAALMIDNGVLWDQIWLFGSPLVNKLQLKPIDEVEVGGAGEGDPTAAYTAQNLILEFDNIIFYEQPVLVSPSEAGFYKMFPGVDGQLCNTFFKHFVVEFDFISNEVILHKPEQFVYSGNGSVLEMTLNESGTYAVPFSFTTLDNKTYNDKADIDFGGIYAFMIALNNKNNIQLPERAEAIYSHGAQGRATEFKGKIKSMTIGKYTFENPTVFFGDEKVSRIHPDNLGVIGLPLFMKFNIIFDYLNNKIYIDPNANYSDQLN